MTALLVSDGKGKMTDGANAYRIPGYPHLRVEPCYDSPPDRYPGRHARATLYGWRVRDERFAYGLDRYRRDHAFFAERLANIRQWVRDGGPAKWNPSLPQTQS